MIGHYVAVVGLTLAPQGIVSGGTVSISSAASLKVKVQGNGVYKSSLDFSVTGANAVGYDPGTVTGTGSILASATKVKADGSFVMRENDSASISMTGTIGGTPTPFTEPWKITAAGQSKVSGN